VAQQVRTLWLANEVGALESVFHHQQNTIPGGKWPARRHASHEHAIGSDVRGTAIQISEQHITDILRERQSQPDFAPFSRYLQRVFVECVFAKGLRNVKRLLRRTLSLARVKDVALMHLDDSNGARTRVERHWGMGHHSE